jgi:hypothetical protein
MRLYLLQFQGDHEGGHNAIEWQRCDVAMYLISGNDIVVKDPTSLQFLMGKVWQEFLSTLLVMVVYRDYKPIQGSLGKFCAQDAYLPHLSTSKRKKSKKLFCFAYKLVRKGINTKWVK